MYLYSATKNSTPSGLPARAPPSFSATIQRKEILVAADVRKYSKDTVSDRLNVKGSKQADTIRQVEILQLRRQLEAFPESLKERSRADYLLNQNNKRRILQEFQCHVLIKLDTILKQQMIGKGDNPRKYHIGGHDHASYGENNSTK